MKQFLLGWVSIGLLSCSSIKPTPSQTDLSVWQGFTSSSETIINVLIPPGRRPSYKVIETLTKQNISFVRHVFKKKYSDWRVEQFHIKNLKLKKHYALQIFDSKDQLITEKYFKTLNLKKTKARIAVASCLDERKDSVQKQIWPEFLAHKPDIIFLIGDNTYLTKSSIIPGSPTPKEIWTTYISTFSRLQLYKTEHLIPIMATWDDNDYGKNNGGRHFQYKTQSQKVFSIFFPRQPIKGFYKPGPGVSGHLRAFSQNFLFMDNRSFRSPNNQIVDYETHWGKKQENWLIHILNHTHNPSWIINGDQIFGGYSRFESYEGSHPNSFKKIMLKIKFAHSPVIFLTGDRHLFETMKIATPDFPYTTYEITTSAIHANVFPNHWSRSPNPRQIQGIANKYNYAILDTSVIKNRLNLHVHAYTLGGKKIYDDQFSVRKP